MDNVEVLSSIVAWREKQRVQRVRTVRHVTRRSPVIERAEFLGQRFHLSISRLAETPTRHLLSVRDVIAPFEVSGVSLIHSQAVLKALDVVLLFTCATRKTALVDFDVLVAAGSITRVMERLCIQSGRRVDFVPVKI